MEPVARRRALVTQIRGPLSGGYTFVAMLILAACLVLTILQNIRLTQGRARDRVQAQAAIRRLSTQLRTGDPLPSIVLKQLRGAATLSGDSLARVNELIYFFSPSCPACRALGPLLSAASAEVPIAWVSVVDETETMAYADSLNLGRNVWMATDPRREILGIPGVPAVIRVQVTRSGLRVANFAAGASGVAFLLSSDPRLDRELQTALSDFAFRQRSAAGESP